MGNLLCNRLRTLLLLCVGCFLFAVLHNAFGTAGPSHTKPTKTLPRKVWQSWKVDPLRYEARDAERAATWTGKNPGYRYECLTDDNAAAYVEHHFGPEGFNRPDIVSIYTGLKARIIQADLLRYLIMYVEGGVWADIDVEAIRPVDRFIPKRFEDRRHEIGLIIGVETDEPELKDHPVLGSKAQSFCQWTFVAAPRLPVMMRLVDNILIWLSKLSVDQGKPISDLTLDFDEVLSGTGPSAFTKAILADLSARTGRNVTWVSHLQRFSDRAMGDKRINTLQDEFHDMDESKIVGNTLVLTSQAFAAGTGHSSSGNHDGRAALVKHHFHASSWTTAHPRYKHPIYGEVEKCNWDLECIKLWDANTAFFAALPKEDQMKMIAMKDREEADAVLGTTPFKMLEQAPGLPLVADFEAGDSSGSGGDAIADLSNAMPFSPLADEKSEDAPSQQAMPEPDAAALAFIAALGNPLAAAEAPPAVEAHQEHALPITTSGNADDGTPERGVSEPNVGATEPAEKSEISKDDVVFATPDSSNADTSSSSSDDTHAINPFPMVFDSSNADTAHADSGNADLSRSDTLDSGTASQEGKVNA